MLDIPRQKDEVKYTLKHVTTGAYLLDTGSGPELRTELDTVSPSNGWWSLVPFDLDDTQLAFSGGLQRAGRFTLHNVATKRLLSVGGVLAPEDPAGSKLDETRSAQCVEKNSSVREVNVLVVERRPVERWLATLFRLKNGLQVIQWLQSLWRLAVNTLLTRC